MNNEELWKIFANGKNPPILFISEAPSFFIKKEVPFAPLFVIFYFQQYFVTTAQNRCRFRWRRPKSYAILRVSAPTEDALFSAVTQ